MQDPHKSVSYEGKLESHDHKPAQLLVRGMCGCSVLFSDYRVPGGPYRYACAGVPL